MGIIVANVLVFLWELAQGPHLERLLINFAIIPARYTSSEVARRRVPHYFE